MRDTIRALSIGLLSILGLLFFLIFSFAEIPMGWIESLFASVSGGVESLIGYPWTMSHGAFPPEEKRRKGISEATVRLSVGIEHADDLCEDLERALAAAARAG